MFRISRLHFLLMLTALLGLQIVSCTQQPQSPTETEPTPFSDEQGKDVEFN